jgi:hypothetical protein
MPGWASTAIDRDQGAFSSSMIGVARGSKDQHQTAPAAANPYLACVREEPHHPHLGWGCAGAGAVLGLGLGLGLHLELNKSEGESPGQGDHGSSNVACVDMHM